MKPIDWRFQAANAKAALPARREFLRRLRTVCEPQSDFEAAEIVFGELIANAICHASGAIDITVRTDDGGAVMLEITGEGPDFAITTALPAPAEEGGRGLYIVSQLCSRIAMTRAANATTITVTLPVSIAFLEEA